MGTPENTAIAKAAIHPTMQSAGTIREYGRFVTASLDLTDLVAALQEQSEAVVNGDLARGEAMLAVQAHTLDAIFNNLACRAALDFGEYPEAADCYMKLALRAQSQCRSTWETISTIKHPPVANYVGQANIARGHQQVNNASRAGNTEKPPNELLETAEHEPDEWMDKGTPSAATRSNPELETVGEVNRTKDN